MRIIDEEHEHLLAPSAALLASRPFETISIADVADAVGCSTDDIVAAFGSMHGLGAAVLTHEGSSMRDAQRRAAKREPDPLLRIPLVFRLVGENLANDVVVRAGIRIAGESHHCFPGRRINPFRTWRAFLTSLLSDAITNESLSSDTDIEGTAWLITAAGLGTKDLLMFTGGWHEAPALLERCARLALSATSAARATDGERT